MIVPITLKNTSDLALFRTGFLEQGSVRAIRLNAVVKDDWKCRLFISTQLQKLLGLPTKVIKTVFFEESKEHFAGMTEAIELQIGNRRTTVCPFVLQNLQTLVIGSVLLGELCLEVNSIQNRLVFSDRKLRI